MFDNFNKQTMKFVKKDKISTQDIPSWINTLLVNYPENNRCMICECKQYKSLHYIKSENLWLCSACEMKYT